MSIPDIKERLSAILHETPHAEDSGKGYVAVDRRLLAAACLELREWKVDRGGDDQVVLDLEAALLGAPGSHEGTRDLPDYWREVVGETEYKPAVIQGLRHIHPLTVKPVFERSSGTDVADVVVGLIFATHIARNRAQYFIESNNRLRDAVEESRRLLVSMLDGSKPVEEIQQQIASNLKALGFFEDRSEVAERAPADGAESSRGTENDDDAPAGGEDWVLAEVERLRPHYTSNTGTDAARNQMLDHFARLAAAKRAEAVVEDVAPKRKHPLQPIEMDEVGTARFLANKIVRFLLDAYKPGLNELAIKFGNDDTGDDKADYVQLMMLIGYSIDGFAELSLDDEIVEFADRQVESIRAEMAATAHQDGE